MVDKSSLLVEPVQPKEPLWRGGALAYKLIVVAALTMLYTIAEIVLALRLNSLTLFSDGFHNLSDVIAVVTAIWADQVSQYPSNDILTFGWKRADLLGGLWNGFFLLSLSVFTLLQAIPRFFMPDQDSISPDVKFLGLPADWLFVGTAGAGMLINFMASVILCGHGHGHSHGGGHGHSHGGGHGHSHGGGHGHSHGGHRESIKSAPTQPSRQSSSGVELITTEIADYDKLESSHHHDLSAVDTTLEHIEVAEASKAKQKRFSFSSNVWGVLVHYIGDTLSSLFVMCVGLLVHYFPNEVWTPYCDPTASVMINVLILFSAVPLVKSCMWTLMQTVPRHINVGEIRNEIEKLPGIEGVHDLHVWSLVDDMIISSVHIVVERGCNFNQIADAVREILHKHGLHSSTIQPEYLDHDSWTTTWSGTPARAHRTCSVNCVTDCESDWCCNPRRRSRHGDDQLIPS